MSTATRTATYTVVGMSCAHCVAAVTDEVFKVRGVVDVNVDLESGRLTVTSDRPLTDAEVAEAVGEAGYEVAP
jgi:copper chaperone CopZ